MISWWWHHWVLMEWHWDMVAARWVWSRFGGVLIGILGYQGASALVSNRRHRTLRVYGPEPDGWYSYPTYNRKK